MMRKKTSLLISIAIAFLFLITAPLTSINASNDADTWSIKTINDPKKVWTISFSQPLKDTTVNSTNVYVEDENYRLFFTNVTLSSDKKSIIVTPKDNQYKENTVYKLNISKNVTSDKGKKLEKDIIMPFNLNGTAKVDDPITGNAVQSVSFKTQNFATMVTVRSNDSVSIVRVNGKEMHYDGNNYYSIGLANVKGDSVTIQAYDGSGKMIYSKVHKVN